MIDRKKPLRSGGGSALNKEMCYVSQDQNDLNQDQEPATEKSGSKVFQAEGVASAVSSSPRLARVWLVQGMV